MPSVRKSVIVPHACDTMFALVDDVERYPEFLPWCGGSKVLAKRADGKTARLDINYLGVTASFTTDNVNVPGKSIALALKKGPFKKLFGKWTFKPLAKDGCRVELAIDYTLSSGPLEALVGLVFGQIVETLVERFVERAAEGAPR